MAKTQKPKTKTGERSNRANGKAPKKKLKTNEQFKSGKTINGYTIDASDRRKSIRNLSFDGLQKATTAKKRIKRKP